MKRLPYRSEWPDPERLPFRKAHRKAGHLWVRRTRTGKSVLTGYIWYFNRHKHSRVVMTVKIIVNPLKTTVTQPDYTVYDYSREYAIKKRHGLLNSYRDNVEGRPQEVAKSGGDSEAPGREPGREY